MKSTVFGDMKRSKVKQAVSNDGLQVMERDPSATKIVTFASDIRHENSIKHENLHSYIITSSITILTMLRESVVNHPLGMSMEQVYPMDRLRYF